MQQQDIQAPFQKAWSCFPRWEWPCSTSLMSPGPRQYLYSATHLVLKNTLVSNISEIEMPWDFNMTFLILVFFCLLLVLSLMLFKHLIFCLSLLQLFKVGGKDIVLPFERWDDRPNTERFSNMSQVTEHKIIIVITAPPPQKTHNPNNQSQYFLISCYLSSNSPSCIIMMCQQLP